VKSLPTFAVFGTLGEIAKICAQVHPRRAVMSRARRFISGLGLKNECRFSGFSHP
jgi:hypothetical protein